MKIIGLMIIFLGLMVISINNVSAATYYWVGVNNGKWANASSWASSSGGAGGMYNLTFIHKILHLNVTK